MLEEEIALLDGASAEFDQELVSKGELSPVFFGSALTNFGVETFLEHFLAMSWDEKKNMGLAGRSKIEREFDRQIVVRAYVEEIERLES